MDIEQENQTTESPEVETEESSGALADIMAAVEANEKATASPQEKTESTEPAEAARTDAAAEASHTEDAAKTAPEKAADPLSTWKQADKEMFAELPKPAQDFVLRRERERDSVLTKRLGEVAEFKKEYGAVDELFKPYREQMRSSGLTAFGVIQAWRNVEQALMDGRGEQVIRDIAKAYKIDLAKVTGGSQTKTEPTETEKAQKELEAILNPFMSPVQQELAATKKELEDLKQFRESFTTSQQQQRVNEVQNQILAFANEKDAKGNLAHPYFKDVEDDMGRLAMAYKASGQAVPSLKDLYENAIWANTSTRARLMAQSATTTSKTVPEARAKAIASKRAGSSVQGSAGSAQIRGADGPKSVREALEAAYDEIDSRA